MILGAIRGANDYRVKQTISVECIFIAVENNSTIADSKIK